MQGACRLSSLPPECSLSRLGSRQHQTPVSATTFGHHGYGRGSGRQEGKLMLRLPLPDESAWVSPAGEGCLFPKAGLGSLKILEQCWHPALGTCTAVLRAVDF